MDILVMRKAHIPLALKVEWQSFPVPWTENMFISELDNPNTFYCMAIEDDVLLGYAGMSWVLDEGYVNNIAVGTEAREKGIGSALLSALIYKAWDLKLSFLTLEVREHNQPAIALYSRLGFSAVGKRRGYYERPTEDAILMTLYFREPAI